VTFSLSIPRRRGVAALTVVAATVGLAVSGAATSASASTAKAASATQDLTLVLPAPPGLWITPMLVAVEKFYPKMGLNVKLEGTDGSSDVTQQLIAGHSQYGVAGASGVGEADEKGYGIKSILALNHDETAVFVTPQKSSIKSLSALKGKNVGITSPTDGAVAIVTQVLKDAGLTVGSDVNLVVVGDGGPAVASELSSGKIAAFAGGASDMSGLVVGGHLPVRSIMPPKWVGLPSDMLVASAKTLQTAAGKATAIKLGEGWVRAAKWARSHPTEAVTLGCKMVPANCQPKSAGVYAEKESLDDTIFGTKVGLTDNAKLSKEISALGLAGKFKLSSAFTNAYVGQMNS
jgi:NitT/TauT family transport system substrate-binding protein